MNAKPADKLWRLTDRILTGDVVFFIGSGFSIDSEGNSTKRLSSLLLARLIALVVYLDKGPWTLPEPVAESGIREEARDLFAGFCTTFAIEGNLAEPARLFNHEVVWGLSRQYYRFNDWITSAYGHLLNKLEMIVAGLCGKRSTKPYAERWIKMCGEEICGRIISEVGLSETYFLKRLGELRTKILAPMPLKRILALNPGSRGKVLFLETLGFNNEEVMAGDTSQRTMADVQASFKNRIRQRHVILGRLAREGLCPFILTTNYDLLIEGGLRLVGLYPDQAGQSRPSDLLPMTYGQYIRITEANEFFRRGGSQRSVQLVKIHGCAETYRHRARQSNESLEAYLPAIVFTYREIQNWRADMWSRDLLRTLLRTKTIIFSGYSTADEVIHNTFRNVYEEIAKRRIRSGTTANECGTPHPEDAPVFFMDVAGNLEFHGLEILRAASEAVGAEAGGLGGHDNLIEFEIGKDAFPNLDNIMTWIFHLTYRKRQLQALDAELPFVARRFLGHPPPPEHIAAIQTGFKKIIDHECCLFESNNKSRRTFHRMVAWSQWFHPSLLRELALAELLQRREGPGIVETELLPPTWYCPTLDHPDWTAWGVVLEIALRRRLAAWRDHSQPEDRWRWTEILEELQPGICARPTLVFFRDLQEPSTYALTLYVAGSEPRWYRPTVRGACRRQWTWRLSSGDLPWAQNPLPASGNDGLQVPKAQTLWRWAIGDVDKIQVRHNETDPLIRTYLMSEEDDREFIAPKGTQCAGRRT